MFCKEACLWAQQWLFPRSALQPVLLKWMQISQPMLDLLSYQYPVNCFLDLRSTSTKDHVFWHHNLHLCQLHNLTQAIWYWLTVCQAAKPGICGDTTENCCFISCNRRSWKLNIQECSKIFLCYEENVGFCCHCPAFLNFRRFWEGSYGNHIWSFQQVIGK